MAEHQGKAITTGKEPETVDLVAVLPMQEQVAARRGEVMVPVAMAVLMEARAEIPLHRGLRDMEKTKIIIAILHMVAVDKELQQGLSASHPTHCMLAVAVAVEPVETQTTMVDLVDLVAVAKVVVIQALTGLQELLILAVAVAVDAIANPVLAVLVGLASVSSAGVINERKEIIVCVVKKYLHLFLII